MDLHEMNSRGVYIIIKMRMRVDETFEEFQKLSILKEELLMERAMHLPAKKALIVLAEDKCLELIDSVIGELKKALEEVNKIYMEQLKGPIDEAVHLINIINIRNELKEMLESLAFMDCD